MRAVGALRASMVVAAIAASVTVLGSAQQTEAAWNDGEAANGAFASGSVTAVTQMTCTAGLLQPVTFNWTAPTGGLARTGYRWTVTGGLTGSGTLAAGATSVQLTNGLLGIGSGTFSLYAVGPGGWQSAAKTGSLSFTTVVLDVLSSCSVP
ncbi:hypothetical protein MUN74_09715 [Agromyces endophyticus]|uniref:hypothetical protein n=1 Tax=Agromyces sp. H17E-10 TaxID=2932244 RepID=UPI001FD0D490|nr:hypothetical protein [Agromyces sp. H17E-10]UOQ87598.1 hypothetical protein MUN74_09715 [Agromyces sp. H17E-10]